MKYIQRPAERTNEYYAAQYVSGQPFDEVLAVARKYDHRAAAVEVPEWHILLVQTTTPDETPGFTEYNIVDDGQLLIYSEESNLLYADDAERFHRQHEPAPHGHH